MTAPSDSHARVGCGAFIRRSDGRLLLVLRGRAPEQGHWGLPGGKVDWMEIVEDAVVRETLEETGLHIHLQRVLCVVSQFERALSPPQHWVAPVYLPRSTAVKPPCCANRTHCTTWAGSHWMRCPRR